MKTRIKVFFLLSALLATTYTNADPGNPVFGEPSPDFTLHGISNWKKKTASLKDFKGRWLVIDAWTVGCVSCPASFPKMNELHNRLRDKATFLILGKEHRLARSWYERYRLRDNLVLPYVFDSLFFEKFGIRTVPKLIIIDPNGILVTITVDKPSVEKLNALFQGSNPFQHMVAEEDKIDFDSGKPFALHNNGGPDDQFLFRTMLTRWKRGQTVEDPDFSGQNNWNTNNKNGMQMLGMPLELLYQHAYFDRGYYTFQDTAFYGKLWRGVVLELKDSSLFHYDYRTGQNIFCYSLLVPDSLATTERLREQMKKDLQNYFGYKVAIEQRDMPVWEARATRNLEHLHSGGGRQKEFSSFGSNDRFGYQNVPVYYLWNTIANLHQEQPPIIDKTGIDFNIDMELDALPTDFDSIIAGLEKQGIKLVKSTKKMKVIVIRER